MDGEIITGVSLNACRHAARLIAAEQGFGNIAIEIDVAANAILRGMAHPASIALARLCQKQMDLFEPEMEEEAEAMTIEEAAEFLDQIDEEAADRRARAKEEIRPLIERIRDKEQQRLDEEHARIRESLGAGDAEERMTASDDDDDDYHEARVREELDDLHGKPTEAEKMKAVEDTFEKMLDSIQSGDAKQALDTGKKLGKNIVSLFETVLKP